MPAKLKVTDRTRVRRLPKRGHHDLQTIYAILDATPLCHVGYLLEGKPAVTPTLHWRDDTHVYWHGSRLSRALRSAEGEAVCLTVSVLDGLVLARSAFHHSANYRAVMLFGRARLVDDPEYKLATLKRFVDGLYPGRWEELRPVTRKEINATTVLRLPIEEASAKIRTGGPVDDAEDYALPIWAGVLPLQHRYGKPQADPRNLEGVTVPDYLARR